MNVPRLFRTVRNLMPVQIAAQAASYVRKHPPPSDHRPYPKVLVGLARDVEPLRVFARSERERFVERAPRLVPGSHLAQYEDAYGLLYADTGQATPLGPGAFEPYPASVRARRAAVASALGVEGLAGTLARAARAVRGGLEWRLMGNHLLENAIGLGAAAAVTEGPEADSWWHTAETLLRRELSSQFLADGGHFERSATYHAWLSAGLLELAILLSRRRGVPPVLEHTLVSALRFLASIRAPDGTYPLFNDAALDAAPTIDGVMFLATAFLENAIAPFPFRGGLLHLEHTGWVFARNEAMFLAFDAGPDGAPYQPGHVHADALTFELWVHGVRTVVDYGVGSYANDRERLTTRSTAVHNTVELFQEDSAEVWSAFRVGRRQRAHVRSVVARENECILHACHDGYRHHPGAPLHDRVVTLTDDSLTLADKVVGPKVPFTSRLRLSAEGPRPHAKVSHGKITEHPSVWYPQFRDPRPAIVLEASSDARPLFSTLRFAKAPS